MTCLLTYMLSKRTGRDQYGRILFEMQFLSVPGKRQPPHACRQGNAALYFGVGSDPTSRPAKPEFSHCIHKPLFISKGAKRVSKQALCYSETGTTRRQKAKPRSPLLEQLTIHLGGRAYPSKNHSQLLRNMQDWAEYTKLYITDKRHTLSYTIGVCLGDLCKPDWQ